MKRLKKSARLLMLLLIILLSTILPVPIPHFFRDKAPKFLIVQVDRKEEENEDEETLARY